MLAMIVTLIFVKKDADYTRRSPVNILTIALNFFISFTFLPFILICAYLLNALGDAGDFLNLVFYLLPALTVFCITASIGLRRRLCYKSALYVQFVTPAIFAVILFVGNLLGAL